MSQEIKYQIRDWQRLYETAQGRRVDKCRYGCIPNKQDGLQYQRMVRDPETFPYYGAFVAVCLTLSKQRTPRHGWLTDTGKADGIPYTAADLHVKTGGIQEEVLAGMLEYCSDTGKMGSDTWIIKYVDGKPTSPAHGETAAEKARRRMRREESKIWTAYAEDLTAARKEKDEPRFWRKMRQIYGKEYKKARASIIKAQEEMDGKD